MLRRNFLYIIVSFTFFCTAVSDVSAQGTLGKEEMTTLTQLEDSLLVLADSMRLEPIPDFRIDICVRFTRKLRAALDVPGSYNYPFSRLAGKIHIIAPDDKSFRIFNWLIVPSENVRRYFGAIQMAGEDARFYPLKDYSQSIDSRDAETAILGNDKWYGCEYYKIMSQPVQGQNAYLLFGYNTNGSSNKKLLDVLTFTEQGPEFGAKIFVMPDSRGQMTPRSRVVLEYKKEAEVFLNYDNTKKMIIFNRLASEVSDPNRKSTYIPTGQMDGLRWDKDGYRYVQDAIPVLKLQDGQAPIDGVMGKGG